MDARMPKRTESQRTGDRAEAIVQTIIDSHPFWMGRRQDHDFGIDLEAEFAPPVPGGQTASGRLLKIQVKGSQDWTRTGDWISVSLSRDYLDYAGQFRIPVILVAIDVVTQEAWFVWLQAWLLETEAARGDSTAASMTVKIPVHDRLVAGLDGPLQRVARGQEPTSMVLGLREVLEAATATNNSDVFDGAIAILGKLSAPSDVWVVQKTIDALLGLGQQPSMWLTQRLVPQLMSLGKYLGGSLTTDQVVRLVGRGDTYSRAGLFALSELYDVWWEHARTLRLAEAFQANGSLAVAWYCNFREAHPGRVAMTLWSDLIGGRIAAPVFEGVGFGDIGELADAFLSKFFNRGESALLDCLSILPDREQPLAGDI